jgi:ribonucleoside-diphosphate reductase alpha chain
MEVYSYGEALSKSIEYFNGDELAAKVFVDKYSLRNEKDEILEDTPEKMHWRMAKELARIEKNKFKIPLSEKEIFSYFDKFKKIIPQGSMMFGIGNYYHYVTLSNCYVIDPPTDSYGGICRTDEQLVQISKRRGGNGTDISYIRPSGLPVKNSSRTTTGIIPFMRRFSNSIREVGQGGRRGALMLTISVHHPQVLDFASVKKDKNEITGANISIRLTDEFLNAVDKDIEYEQRWPVDSKNPTVSIKINARHVWREIIKNAHNMAEPGLLFWDTIIRESPADCYSNQGFETISTNPCSELPLSVLDSCRLIVINLLSYVDNPFTDRAKFNNELFFHDCRIMQRIIDDLVDLEIEYIDKIINKINKDPESKEVKQRELELWMKIRENCFNGRRTGSGITALGDTLAALNIKYGSDESFKKVDEIYKSLKLACYQSSVEISKELGPFPIWKHELEQNNPFLLRIKNEDPALWDFMKKYGRRNIAILTTAPTGTVSILTQTSSGIEPVFQTHYIRRKKITHEDKNARIDFIDNVGDKWQEFPVYHSQIKKWMEISKENDIKKSPWYNYCAEDLNWTDRVKLQSIAQKHIDHAISSTLNLPRERFC